ncbi:major facilitator transporter [Gottschalkia purinilytica]|uniref:Major facilitator transporter n=1 Tax=Gottschalkia purinilytica TaxID=1503 RepID=A0A0L0W8D9_GOTPU|nr:MFS transporter [Gottschalkia purinilytica]KNF07716.1 major facilitator transporter [Gottschalkia purinilytica]
MLINNPIPDRIKKNKSLMFFLTSQTVSNLGDAFHFIAIAALLIKLTGSGTSASFIVICTPISSFFLSSFAGSLGDRFNEKYLLAFIDLLRGLTALLFISNQNVLTIYILMLTLSSFEILYNPPQKKIITSLLDQRDVMIGNSILTGIKGIIFIIGPIIAGIIIDIWGLNTIFMINSLSYFLSTIILFLTRTKSHKSNIINKKIGTKPSIYKDIRSGFKYFKSKISIKELVLINTIASLAIASVNITFYSFAFDTLKVTSRNWGFMMSVFYGTNFVAMVVSIYFDKIIHKLNLLFAYMILITVSIVWLFYSLSNNLSTVILLQFIEGLVISLLTIFINTKLQIITKKEFVARIMGINDIFNNIGKLIGIGYTYAILQFRSSRFIFVLNFFILIFYVVYKSFTSKYSTRT